MVFLRAVDDRCPEVTPGAYADDTIASASSVSALSQFLIEAGSFATVTGQRIKPSKSKLWTICLALVKDIEALRLLSSPFKIVQDIRFLGANFGFHLGKPVDERSSLLAEVCEQTRRAACLPLTAEERGQVIFSAAITRAVHGIAWVSADCP